MTNKIRQTSSTTQLLLILCVLCAAARALPPPLPPPSPPSPPPPHSDIAHWTTPVKPIEPTNSPQASRLNPANQKAIHDGQAHSTLARTTPLTPTTLAELVSTTLTSLQSPPTRQHVAFDQSFIEAQPRDSAQNVSSVTSAFVPSRPFIVQTEADSVDDDDSPVELSGSTNVTPAPMNSNHSTRPLQTLSNSPVHPLLIYSIRFEIRSFDLYNLTLNSNNNYNKYSPADSNTSKSGLVSTSTRSSSAQVSDSSTSYNSPLSNRHPRTLIGGLKNTIGLDFLYQDNESYIFWADVIEERIYRGTLVNGAVPNVDVIVQTGLATAEGLAVDWIGLNIYWVESTLDHIEVASINGSHRRTLIAGNMESPRAIALDPRYGIMFWTDWDKKSPRIEKAAMTGEERETLVHIKNLLGGWPNGLTLDYDTLRVYWIDANSDSIHSVDYEGNNYHEHLKRIRSLEHPFSITLFQNHIFWTDWKTNSVSLANKNNATDARELQRSTNRLFDIKVLHPSRQPSIESSLNPCYISNGGCSHLCLLSKNHTRKCACPRLMKLSNDDTTCEVDEKILLIGKINEIRAVDLEQPLYHVMAPISVPKVFNPKQFEFDTRSKSIFWADSQTNEVKKVQLSAYGIETIIDVIIESPSGLALDWISGNIYVSSAPQKTDGKIFISNLNGEYISILMDHTQEIRSPKSLAVQPLLGLLFCIDENEYKEPIIFVASMDGKNKRIISSRLNNPKLENPTSLTIDYELNRVYWINQAFSQLSNDQNKLGSYNASIQYYSIAEDKIVTVLDESEVKASDRMNPNMLCIDGDDVIVGGRITTEVIIRASKHDLNKKTLLEIQNLDQLTSLRVYNASTQVGSNACSSNNGDCSQLCVPTNSTHRVCKCTMGFTINPQNETDCTGKDTFLTYSYNLGMKGIGLEPNSSSDDYYLPPIHKAFRASSIDFVHRDNLIYWVDNEEGTITRINRDTTNYQMIIQGLESEESIAIDWVAENIYWLDPYYDLIEVARLNGSNRYVIASGDMDKANAIVVNPLKGYIVWSDIGTTPKIEVANLDGSGRRIIVSSNLTRIDDLSLDIDNDLIYWVDSTSGVVERVREDGTHRQVVFTSKLSLSNSHLVSIAIHKGYLYIADSVFLQGSITRLDLSNLTPTQVIHQQLGEGIRDIAIFAEQPIPSAQDNPCAIDNGGCEDLCIFRGKISERRCICSHGKLREDGRTCKPFDTFLLFSKFSQIDSIHITDDELLSNTPYPSITTENRGSIISLAVDFDSQRVIYSEINRNQICSVHFNGTDKQVLVDKQSMVEGIAYVSNQLYWNSIHDNSISRLNISSAGILGKNCDTCSTASIEKLIKFNQDDKPRGIAVDVCTSYIFWTNWNSNAAIQRASPRTNYKIETIINTDIKVPNGITIDQSVRRLYWCDARLDKIETCNMDGSNRVILISATPQHPFALAIWDNYVFWTDWLARGVFRADKHTGQKRIQMKKVAQRPMGIAVVAPSNYECPNDPCMTNNGNCDDQLVCIYHRSNNKIECKEPSRISHDVNLPPHRCRSHSRTGECELVTYHDVIMDTMDRYNLTDISSLDHSKVTTNAEGYKNSYKETTSWNHERSQSFKNLTPKSATDQFPPRVVNTPTRTTQQMNESASFMYDLQNQTLPSKTISKSNQEMLSITSQPTTSSSAQGSIKQPDLLPTSTQSLQVKPPQYSTTTAESSTLPTTQATAASPSSPPPCQIVPAALSPTDASASAECRQPNHFKCYLSDKLICISSDKRCDGNNDCPSKEDENDCYLSKRGSYNVRRDTSWFRFVPVILIILAAAVAAMILVFGTRGRKRWFVGAKGAFNHRRMFDDNGTNIEISNPMFDEDDTSNLTHCPFSIDLNERTTNFSNPLYERQVLLMTEKRRSKS